MERKKCDCVHITRKRDTANHVYYLGDNNLGTSDRKKISVYLYRAMPNGASTVLKQSARPTQC